MFEGGVTQSPSKLDANFKTWLLGQTRLVKLEIDDLLLSEQLALYM